MEALPITTPQQPPAPAGADNAADPANAAASAPDGDFHDMLCRNLAGATHGAKGTGSAAADAPGDETRVEADDKKPALDTAGLPSASDSALALLAALPQQGARLESAQHAVPVGKGGENVVDAARRADGPAIPAPRLAPSHPGDAVSAQAVEAEKNAEKGSRSTDFLSDLNLATQSPNAQAGLHPAYAPAAQQAVDPAAAGPAANAPARIDTPLGAPGWSTALADQVVLFAGEKQQVAELHIHPPHLGPVDIRLTISDDQTSVAFASPHAIVRETIESALPRLREVLAESGINLGQASVTADSPRDGSAYAQSRQSWSGGGERSVMDDPHIGVAARAAARRAMGIVDLFA